MQAEKNRLDTETDDNKKLLKDYEDEIREIDREISEAELMKHHVNFKILIIIFKS